jgi:ribosomal protein S12 methylthiotransferase
VTKFTTDQKIILLNASGKDECFQSSVFIQKVELFFKYNNYTLVNNPQQADVLVFNTCGASDAIADINLSFINRHVQSNKSLIVFGCLCNVSKGIEKDRYIAISSKDINKFSDYFQHTLGINDVRVFCEFKNTEIDSKAAPVFISQGCANKCSFCNIKIAKGHVKSRRAEDIIEDVQMFLKDGKEEIVLISDDCGSYGFDIGSHIGELIDRILIVDDKLKLKVYNIYPEFFLKFYPFFKKYVIEKRITFILIPIQSASGRILGLMDRPYDLDLIMRYMKEIKEANRDIQLFSHFIVNFPTETTDDFKKSINYATYFDHVFFMEYADNIRMPASKLFPKCAQTQLEIKRKIFEAYKKRGMIKGEFFSWK